ncbi:MAG: prenyltransferase, partial [Anaerolineales bacterium]
FVISGAIATLSGLYALAYTKFSPTILGLFTFGALILLLYTWPLKYYALGELFIFLIWGPIMISSVYLVLNGGWTDKVWMVALAGVPFGLSVVSINLGKHIDKSPEDKRKHVGTLPVMIGEQPARYLDMFVLLMIYVVIIYLIFVPRFFTPIMLIVLFAGKRWLYAFASLLKPRPSEPPKEWPAWPTWFSGFAFYHNRLFSNLFLLGMLLNLIIRIAFPTFWVMH